MDTTEDYLDQLLQNMTNGGSIIEEPDTEVEQQSVDDSVTDGEEVNNSEEAPSETEPSAANTTVSNDNGMMSPEEIAALFAAQENTGDATAEEGTASVAMSETGNVPEEPEVVEVAKEPEVGTTEEEASTPSAGEATTNSNGMMSPEEIAALFAAQESTEEPTQEEPEQVEVAKKPEVEPTEEEASTPSAGEATANSNVMMSPEEIAALFAAQENPEEAPTEEPEPVEVAKEPEVEPTEEEASTSSASGATTNDNGMMSPEEIAALFAAQEGSEGTTAEVAEQVEVATEPEVELTEEEASTPSASEPTAADSNGMMSPEEIAALFAAQENPEEATTEEPEPTPVEDTQEAPSASEAPAADNGMMSPEEIAALFAAQEGSEGTTTEESEPAPVEDTQEAPSATEAPAADNNGMMSPEEIAALFAAQEDTTDASTEESVVSEDTPVGEATPDQAADGTETVAAGETSSEELPEIIEEEPVEVEDTSDELSLDDMLAGMRAEDGIIGEEPMFATEESPEPGTAEETDNSNEDDNILNLLNMMSDDEDLKDIGDLLKESDEEVDLSEDELFGEPSMDEPVESQEIPTEKEEEKKLGFFARLFGKKKKESSESTDGDENEQIIQEVEEEIQEKEKKEQEKEEKKRKKKEKKEKKAKGKKGKEQGEEGEEEEEGQSKKKPKKEKKKKEKPVKVVVPQKKEPPLPKKPVILIFLMAGSILALVLISHNFISYQSDIGKADNSFINRNYAEAFEDMLGMEVKDEDKELYGRIRIMTKLDVKYKMYLAHIQAQKYDEALNDLVMGVVKYKQYSSEAESLGITEAFNDEYQLIVEQLNNVYGVDAEQAAQWHDTLSTLEYSKTIRSVVKAAGYAVEEEVTDTTDSGEETTDSLADYGIEEVQ